MNNSKGPSLCSKVRITYTTLQYSGPQKSCPLITCISYGSSGHDFCGPLYLYSHLLGGKPRSSLLQVVPVGYIIHIFPHLFYFFSSCIFSPTDISLIFHSTFSIAFGDFSSFVPHSRCTPSPNYPSFT